MPKSLASRSGQYIPALLVIACSACSPKDWPDEPATGFVYGVRPETSDLKNTRFVIGSPALLLKDVSALRERAGFRFVTSAGEPIATEVEDFYLKDGQLSMRGRAVESAHSSFILKGNSTGIYGWLVLDDRKLAFEYTTNTRNELVVEQVPAEKLHFVCTHPRVATHVTDLSFKMLRAYPWASHIGAYDGSSLNKLQSLPGSQKVLYLEIAPLMNGETPKAFSKDEMYTIWQIASAAFSMFQVNVTTDPAVYAAAGPANSGKNCFVDGISRSTSALNIFGTTDCAFIYTRDTPSPGAPLNAVKIGLSIVHETGHLLGLSHDGGPNGAEYFDGLPAFKWAPIMGNWVLSSLWGPQAMVQWSRGEYAGANNQRDDLALMGRYLPLREDDIADKTSLVFRSSGELSIDDNHGQIASSGDSDTFTFRIMAGGGHATLTIDRIEVLAGAMLDVAAEIQDGSGNVVARSNDPAARTAHFDLPLSPGDYSLIITGGAEGTPLQGFSNYSSLGFYGISGRLTGVQGSDGVDAADGGADAFGANADGMASDSRDGGKMEGAQSNDASKGAETQDSATDARGGKGGVDASPHPQATAGCSCRVTSAPSNPSLSLGLLAGLIGTLLARRSRRN